MLDERLQQELKMRLRAMIWTLAFVLLMAIVSMIYVWAKHETGLDKTPTESTRT
jgi:nitrate/TMAO reductase-like tetraheme cytochrome c subunit